MAEREQQAPRSLIAHFQNSPYSDHASLWTTCWDTNWSPWDRGGPSAALSDLLEQKRAELFDLPTQSSRKTALVPGCGRGHDVLLLSTFGYDTFGLDVSAQATLEAEKNADAVNKAGGLGSRSEGGRLGTHRWLVGDFFEDGWVREADVTGGRFDLIFDYTFCAALPPSARPAWAKRLVQLLAPGGRLVCLEFPSSKKPSEPGPPWALPPHAYLAYLGHPGEETVTDEHGGVLEEHVELPGKDGLRRILHVKPARTHQAGMNDGKVDDWISVWVHNGEM